MPERELADVTNLDRYGNVPLPWSRPRDLLTGSVPGPEVAMFVSTIRPEGRPHTAGIGALWYDGPVGYDIRDLRITAGYDTAFASYLYRVTGTMTNGSTVDMWVRSTVCLRKSGGDWLIVHEHTSVPFDAESGRAALDLTP